MTIIDIYERISLKVPMEQKLFFNALNDTINAISARYGSIPGVTFDNRLRGDELMPIHGLIEEIPLLPMYHNAVVDGIMYRSGQGDAYGAESDRKADEAYRYYWFLHSGGKKTRRRQW